jgi:hypothetical protein
MTGSEDAGSEKTKERSGSETTRNQEAWKKRSKGNRGLLGKELVQSCGRKLW